MSIRPFITFITLVLFSIQVPIRISIRICLSVLYPMNIPLFDPLRQLSQLPNVSFRLGDLPLEAVAIVEHLDLLEAKVFEGGGVGLDGGHHAHDVLGAVVVEELGAEVPDQVLEGKRAAVGSLVNVRLHSSGGRARSLGFHLLLPDLYFGKLSERFRPSLGDQREQVEVGDVPCSESSLCDRGRCYRNARAAKLCRSRCECDEEECTRA